MTAESGLYMPAEWSRHRRTLTAWPDQSSQNDKEILRGAELDVAAISNAIAEFEPVMLLCRPKNVASAEKLVSSSIKIQEMEVDELWLRDTGPVFVKNSAGKILGVDFNFNYWGAKYANH